METIQILKLPFEAAKFLGHQLLGGAWADLPAIPQTRPTRYPMRAANIQYLSTPEIPDNIQIGEE